MGAPKISCSVHLSRKKKAIAPIIKMPIDCIIGMMKPQTMQYLGPTASIATTHSRMLYNCYHYCKFLRTTQHVCAEI